MADAGEVKAKASIEYDPSGMKQFKEDLASLPQMVGGLGQSAGQAGSELANLDESLARNAESGKTFSATLAELPKMVQSGTSAATEMSGALAGQRSAAEEAASAHETLQKSIESNISAFEKAPASIQVASEHTQKYAQSVQTVSESFDPSMMNDFVENTAVFQDALVNPAPFQVIGQHLRETGQTWGDFTSSLTSDNEAMAYEMAANAGISGDHLDMLGAQLQSTGRTFTESASNAKEFTNQFTGITDAVDRANRGINEFGGVGNALYGPEKAVSSLSDAINEFGGVGEKLYGPMPAMKSVGFASAFGEAFSSITGVLDQIAMPLMAVQMIGQAVGMVGQAMYDSAAIAEGPAAHSFGTFTGTVDALGQSLQRAGGQFSEGFGQALLPTLNALNNQAGSSDLGGLGQFAGGITSTIANLSLITTGIDPWGGVQGLVNQGAALIGVQQPFQGPAPANQAQVTYEQSVAMMPQTVRNLSYQTRTQSDQLLQMASDPVYLQSQDEAQAAQTVYQRAQQRYNSTHYINPQKLLMDYQEQQYDATQMQNYQYQMDNQPGFFQQYFETAGDMLGINSAPPPSNPNAKSASQSYGSNYYGQTGYGGGEDGGGGGGGGGIDWGGIGNNIGGFFGGIGNWFQGLFGGGGGETPAVPATTSTGGCFVAGTPVLLADGSSKPIELLRVDERVLSYDGEKQVPATIIGCIMFPAKQTYELTFSDGRTLVTTDSHPLASLQGWKSISPESTALENPGLPVSTLKVGDDIYTADGTLCRLLSIQKREITHVYNITVGGSHTYYAGSILVHNAKAHTIGSGSLANDGTGSEQVQVSHTFVASVQWEANNLQKQFTGVAQWAGQGLSNTFQGIASWVGQGLSNTFQGIANWVGQGLANTFQGIANWVGQGLSNTFQGIANWVGQGLENTFQGVANWVGQGLSNTFKGVASWFGSGLEHTFNAVASWTAQNLTPNFTVNPSFTMLAEGTSNWGGGPAIVGEAGPEVVEHNGQYSMFDAGASLVNLPPGSNVYPMKNLAGSSVAQFANGTGDNVIPITFGVKGGNNNAPESINVYLQIDGQTFWSATGMSLAQSVYAGSGNRSY